MGAKTLRSTSEEQTAEIGLHLASELRVGDVVALFGDLGAGKTELVKSICDYFSVEELVTSPTFTIINQYNGVMPDGNSVLIYHVDLYRIESPEQLANVGFDDMIFAHDAIKLVEWPERAQHLLPEHVWHVRIDAHEKNDEERLITVEHS